MNADNIIQKNSKKIIIFIISILCLFSLTGCNAKADAIINYKEDGTGSVSMTLLLPNEVFKDENTDDQNTENVENTENNDEELKKILMRIQPIQIILLLQLNYLQNLNYFLY